MRKRKPSKRSPRSTPILRNDRSVAASILRGASEVAAHLRGDITLPGRVVETAPSVRKIRQSLQMSQSMFARRFGFSARTIQEWEQGRAVPDSAVSAYLTVLARNPQAVMDALDAVV